jgi:FKBP-type peptidyl-prolyl cis-trans isomerase
MLKNSNPNSMIKKVYQTSLLLVVAVLLMSLVSCDPSAKYEKEERQSIANYLSSSSVEFTKEPSGLYYYESLAGTGEPPAVHDTAYVTYTGKFLDGTTFDTNVGKTPFSFPVGEGYVIAGFDEGIMYMKLGGKALMIIPSNLAYGSTGYYTIGGFTPLLYEVELTKIVAGVAK